MNPETVKYFAKTLNLFGLLAGEQFEKCIHGDNNKSEEQIKAKGISNIQNLNSQVFLESILGLNPPPVVVNWGIRKEIRQSELSLYSLEKSAINPINSKRVSDGPSWTKPISLI